LHPGVSEGVRHDVFQLILGALVEAGGQQRPCLEGRILAIRKID